MKLGAIDLFRKYGSGVYRLRWVIVVVWLALIAVAIAVLPNLKTVVASKNTTYLSNSSPVIVASHLVDKIDPAHASKSTAVVAIHNPNGLSSADEQYFTNQLKTINQNHQKYDVTNVQGKFNTDASVASNFVSKDGTTEIAVVGLQSAVGDQKLPSDIKQLKSTFASPPGGSKVYLTGDAPIQQDNINISQKGVSKTAVVTVILVLLILLIVFRSVLAPLLTLVAIGLSFEFSSSVVAWLATFGLPVSTFTQTFLVATLFGAGTDYSIILLNRFREELAKNHGDKGAALAASMSGVAKTVIFSSLTVIVAFAALYFAKFGLYQSAVGVSIGILITVLTCLAFLPALMGILGGSLYWPRKPAPGEGHQRSRLWGATARMSTRRPWVTILVLLVILVPIAFLFTDDRTFDPASDIPQAPSIKGLQVVSNALGAGRAMPSSIVLQTNGNLRSQEGLATIAKISSTLTGVSGVQSVDSATQPAGSPITDFQISQQNKQAAEGLKQVQSGLSQLQSKLGGSTSSGETKQLNQLASGAEQVSSGVSSLSQGLNQFSGQLQKLQSGGTQVAQGAGSLNSGLSKLHTGLTQTHQGAQQLQSGITQASQAASQLQSGSANLATSEQKLSALASQLANSIASWTKSHPGSAQDPNWQQIVQMSQAMQQGTASAASGASQVASGTKQLNSALSGLQSGAGSLSAGTLQSADAAKKIASGAGALKSGATQVQQGAAAAASGATKLANGAKPLVSGSQQVASGVKQLPGTFQDINKGLVSADAGVKSMKDGTTQVMDALNKSAEASTVGDPGFFVPKSAVDSNASLKKAMDAYISPDGHIAKFTIVLKNNPYSQKAMNTVEPLKNAARLALSGSPISSGTIYATGTTPTQAELNSVSSSDFTRTMVIILVSIFILLTIMLQSLIAPLYIILSLAGTYFVTMGLLQTITVHVMHKTGLSWPVPFFVFLLLVALGVDYSIFLMARFEEEYKRGLSPKAAIRDSMEKMGGVIFSAAAIMAGTFGSMMVAGVVSLMEIGLAVVMGLVLYTFVLLAFFIPSAVSVIGRGHGWPFQLSSEDDEDSPRRARRTKEGLV